MDEAEFDRFAAEYNALHSANVAITGELPEYFAEYKIRDLAAEFLALHPNRKPKILDFGAGIGTSVPFMCKYLPRVRITCLDVSRKSLAIGRDRFGHVAEFIHFEGKRLPIGNQSHNIVFAACVFHHINHSEHFFLLHEFHRVLTREGLVLIYEHNPYNPLTRNAVNNCVFDENARLLKARSLRQQVLSAGFRTAVIRYRVFFPHVLRALRPLEKWMTRLPLGAQYYVVASK